MVTPIDCGLSGIPRQQNLFECSTFENQYTYNCSNNTSGKFQRSKGRCQNDPLLQLSPIYNYTMTFLVSVLIPYGFSHVRELESIPIKTGSFLAWSKNSNYDGSLSLDPTCSSSLPVMMQNGSNFVPLQSNNGYCVFNLNVFVARADNKISALDLYADVGDYLVNAQIQNNMSSFQFSQYALVIGNLTNLTILVTLEKKNTLYINIKF